ncbi:tyrosine-protein phosphatase [Gordonia soli]|uniref:Tyrosine specific protein phosphatases domain-containing protein n=1 Tax=Gordonia soli NBRC 108243 TaxID=1223545 RepID=M0QG12_9ACTN|nr:tyrosine-protein phosphatase [Gordonia soli]GAC67369.1 hypothetical protein GS4_07_01180 [Gordonia soli NBRC 108243]
MTTADTDRDVAGLLGFRYVEGLRTDDGRRVRSRVLMRSATPQFVPAAEAKRFVEVAGLRSIVDLRLPHEVAAEGSGGFSASGVRITNVPFAVGTRVSATSAVAPMLDADPLVGTYLGYLAAHDAIRGLVAELLRDDALPLMVHCTVGKDRTGVAVAILLDAIGVLRSEISRDYVAKVADVGAMMDRLRTMASYGDAVDVYPPQAYTALAATMHRFLAWVDELHGGTRAYLSSIGVGDDEVRLLADRLLETDDQPPAHQVIRHTLVDADPDSAWAIVGDVGGVHRWIPGLSDCAVDGDVRSVTFADGSVAHERIQSHDDDARAYEYTYLDGPIPLDAYVSTISVGPPVRGGGRTLIVWDAAMHADAATAGAVADLYDAGIATLVERLD